MDRYVFYGLNDAVTYINFKRAIEVIENFDERKYLDINDILELVHIQKMFAMNIRNISNNKICDKYSSIKTSIDKTVKSYILSFDNENIIETFETIDYSYNKTFWNLFVKYNCYKRIEHEVILNRLKLYPAVYREISRYKKLVEYYSRSIVDYIEKNVLVAEYILSHKESIDRKNNDFYLPKKLSDKQINNLMEQYISSEEANINYLRLIINSRALKIDDKIKYKAQQRSILLEKKIFKGVKGVPIGGTVSFSKTHDIPFSIETDELEGLPNYIYSEKYLQNTLDSKSIFMNFRTLFKFINFQGCIDLVYRDSPGTLFKLFGMSSKNVYPESPEFIHKEIISDGQLFLYREFLKNNNIELEDVLNDIISDLFVTEFNLDLSINFPSISSRYFEKTRTLAPEIELFMKQYKMYVKDGEIDMNFIRFSSKPFYFSAIKSKLHIKYIYGKGSDFKRISSSLCSPYSNLKRVGSIDKNYKNLYELLINENLKITDFKVYQRQEIEYLIEKKILYCDFNNFIKVYSDMAIIFLCLYNQEVMSYYYFAEGKNNLLDKLEKEGIIEFDNGLFTKAEISYLNYYLNKREFTNSLDLRNKYLHGVNSDSKEIQKKDYNSLLKVFILILWKVYDDLTLTKEAVLLDRLD